MISIVVPVYNVEKYLKECVDSILAQTYTDYEIILVDDGSTDSSGSICDEYTKYSKIQVIHKKNAGLGMARNSGIEIAKGEFITFLDSDDYWSPDALEKLMAGIKENHADTCIGGYTRVTTSGEVVFEEYPELSIYSSSGEVKKKIFPRLMGSAPDRKDAFRPSVWNAIYSMSIIKENRVRFPSEREYIAEDVMFDLDYYRHSECVAVISSSGYYYRVTPGSLTQKYKSDRFEKVVYLYQEVLKRLRKYEYDDICELRAKRQFFVYIRSCIRQESISISGKTRKEAVVNIEKICREDFTRLCISNYPVNKLGFSQQIFLFLVRNNMATVLYVLVCRSIRRAGKA